MQRRARRRLIGAIALVVFVVIALPMVFDREPRPITHDLAIRIPSQDTPFKPRLAPEAPKAEEPVALPPQPEPNKAEQKPAEPAAKAIEQPKAKPAEPKVAEAKPAEAKSARSAFIVPLGAYSNAANAKQVRDKVAAAGYKTFAETIKGAKGDQLRVRAGPFASREAAEQARAKLKLLGLDPVGAVALREQP